MSAIKKAVIPVAGFGTRFLPATKAQPKEMLTIIDQPVIQYIVEEMVAAGIEDIILVTSGDKRAIEDHFDHYQALEDHLEKTGKFEELEKINRISEMANFIYIRQKGPYGNGTPIMNVRHIVGNEPFAFAFGDDIIKSSVPAIKQMIDVFEKYRAPMVSTGRVPKEDTHRYGIVDGEKVSDRVFKVKKIVEKPPVESAPSNLAVNGRYILTSDIFPALIKAQAKKSKEFFLTDGIEILINQGDFYTCEIDGTYYDCGNKLEFLKAITTFALERDDLKNEYSAYLKNLKL